MNKVILNSTQSAIVEAGPDPLLVIAGPGAGKTTVLRARIERLLAQQKQQHARVLAITFTNVAANNLRKRLADLPTDVLQRVNIGTFHSFAARILQQHGAHLGLTPEFNISNEEADRSELLREALQRTERETETNINYLPLVSRLLERGATRETAAQFVDAGVDSALIGSLLEAYVQVSIQQNQLDFAMLIYLANSLMTRYPAIAKQIRKTYSHICVDEFQDTNDAQFRLLSSFCKTDPSGLLLLADQDQVIFQWNGASTDRLAEASQVFGAETLILPTSFRCPDSIVSAANRLISHNTGRFTTPHFDSGLAHKGSVHVHSFPNEAKEDAWVTEQLLQLSPDHYGDTVVLARNRKRLESVLKICERRQLPVMVPTTRFEFISPPLVFAHSALRLAHRFQTRHLETLCSSFNTMTGIGVDASLIQAEAEAQDMPALEAFARVTNKMLQQPLYGAVCDFLVDNLVARKEFWGFSEVYIRWANEIARSDLGAKFAVDFEDELSVWQNLESVHRGLKSDKVSLSEFLRRLDLESKAPERADLIRLMTVHGAKGLEFEWVYLIGAADGQFPSFQAVKQGPDSPALQEERRSFFVAITRCKANLTITYATSYMGWKKEPSRFIAELDLV